MRHRWIVIPFLILTASPLQAQVAAGARDSTTAPFAAGRAAAPVLRLGLKPLPLPFPLDLPPPPTLPVVSGGGGFGDPSALGPTVPGLAAPGGEEAASGLADTWAARLLASLEPAAWAERLRLASPPATGARRPAAPATEVAGGGPAISVPGDSADAPRPLLPGPFGDFVDLGMRIAGRGELGGAWTRFEPCDPALRFNCNPSALPLLKPDVQFGVRVAGTISDRIHVDVDYDQRREFDAANNINVYYQGLPGEVLQRVELGDVSIRLPASRYLTEGIPGGNFGFKAAGRVGGMEVQAIWAQQKGDVATREFRLGGLRGPEGLVQDARVVLDDADYVKGQFFFLVDPDSLFGAPHVDVLALRDVDAPATLRPARGVEIQLYRDERPSFANPEQQAQLGYFLAEAVAVDGALRHRGQFRRLLPGEDYLVHPSGLWVMLRSPLRHDEALAVAYATEAGGVVGTLDAERAPASAPPTLLLLRGPSTIHQPGQATWRYEMHHVYRIDGSTGVEPSSISLEISLGEHAAGATFKTAPSGAVTLLRLFGLDEDAPADRLDEAHVFQPGVAWGGGGGFGGLGGGFEGGTGVGFGGAGAATRFAGTFVVFPTLRPFASPPPVPSAGLTADEAAAVLGADANPAIYEDPDPVAREAAARFRLNFAYRVRLEGLVSSFSLGAFGIRQGSEKITVDGRVLEPGVDYTIDYDLGQVTLTNPQAILGANPNAEIRATWEQQALFQVAPRTLYGLSARYPLGTAGELNLIGLYQAEKAVIKRPQLGLEPGSIFLGGASGALEVGAGWLDRAVERLVGPGGERGGGGGEGSRLRFAGEVAVSLPNPNRRGATYLDDFEASDEIRLALERTYWRLGSRPEDPVGAEAVLPLPLDVTTAAPLAWQHDLLDVAGRVTGPRLAREIDRQINVAGAQRTEPVLYLSLGEPATAPTSRRWRSITTVLETTGRDMSRSEYLEFYASASPGQELALVFDIGTVSEDAFYYSPTGETNGTYPDGRPWGLGILDEEARVAMRELWSTARDTLGLWNQSCRAEPGQPAYPPGDPRANCTRGNGLVDTEDLDGNGILDGTDGAYFRYVVRLDGTSPYLVRDRNATGTEFALYRIPLRGPDAIAVNGATEGTWRYIKHLRLTVAGMAGVPGTPDVALARMRIIGSRWTKRDVHGILAGLSGDRPGAGAASTEFRVGPVSRITDGAAYAPPPGVGDELQDPNSAYGSTGVEYNEKSLRLTYAGLEPGDRAEAYFRYPQQPRNLLSYRELRLWAVARAGRWGVGDGEHLVVSVGTDPRNRYLYRTPLRPAYAAAGSRSEDWLPEVVIEFDRWFDLKAAAERALLAGDRVPGEPVEVWSEDSTYAVILEDRARAPNLAAVREFALAVYNAGGLPATGEVWIDDLRLGGAVRDAGLAGHGEVEVRAGDLVSASLAYGGRGALFRSMNRDPSYQSTSELGVAGTVQLGRLLPADWGIEAPVTVSHERSALEPSFLEASDVRADRLEGLRPTGSNRTRIGLTLRRAAPTANPWLGWLVDGTQLRFGYETRSAGAATARDEADEIDGGVTYAIRPGARELDPMPGPLEAVLRALLPAAVEETGLFRRIVDSKLRWSPEEIAVASSYARHESRSWRYGGILETGADGAVRPFESPREGLETTARVGFRPFPSLTAGVVVATQRDLLPTARASAGTHEREAIDRARNRIGDLDLGWETNRTMTSRLDFRPVLAPWLRPGIGYSARFRTDRSPSYWEATAVGDDTVAILQRRIQGDRQLTRSILLDPEGLTRSVEGESPGLPLRLLLGLGHALRPVDLSWSSGVGSRFEWETLEPGLGYQLGFGGLDDFRIIDGDTAAAAHEQSAFRARGGLNLPLRAALDVAYGEAASVAIEAGGGRRTYDERTWPDLRLAWTALPIPRALGAVVVHGSASIGYREATRASRYGGPGQTRGGEETGIPVQLTLGFANGLGGSYNGLWSRGRASDPTGETQQVERRHSVQLAGSFVAPRWLRDRIPAPVNVALRYGIQDQEQCRIQAGTFGPCIPFVDLVQRQFSLTLDTVISQLNVGFQMSYDDRQSYVGLRSGSSQFQLGLFGEFTFEAGTFAGGAR
jgi:hypothetical protein